MLAVNTTTMTKMFSHFIQRRSKKRVYRLEKLVEFNSAQTELVMPKTKSEENKTTGKMMSALMTPFYSDEAESPLNKSG